MIKLTHTATIKDFFGVHEVSVIINDDKEYTYSMKSEYDVEQFLRLLKHHPGQALNYLKKHSINSS